jgi:hypothetical protein
VLTDHTDNTNVSLESRVPSQCEEENISRNKLLYMWINIHSILSQEFLTLLIQQVGYGLNNWGVRVSFPVGDRDSSLHTV